MDDVGRAWVAGATPAQVFVDDSGRRRRWVRVAGAAVTAACAAYVGIVVVGLSQTAVGPLEAVPVGGNGEIAGFQNSAGTVPGLLAGAGSTAKPGPAVAKPATRAASVASTRTATPKAAEPKARTSGTGSMRSTSTRSTSTRSTSTGVAKRAASKGTAPRRSRAT